MNHHINHHFIYFFRFVKIVEHFYLLFQILFFFLPNVHPLSSFKSSMETEEVCKGWMNHVFCFATQNPYLHLSL